MIKTVEWTKEGVLMLDQRLLPNEEKYLTLRSYDEVAQAIKKMVVRGAPAIGVSAAMGLALGLQQAVVTTVPDLQDDFEVGDEWRLEVTNDMQSAPLYVIQFSLRAIF